MAPQDDLTDFTRKKVSRRELLRGLGGLAAGATLLPILSACGPSGSTAAPKAAEPTKAGAAAAPAATSAPAPAKASKKVVFARTRDPSGTADKMIKAFNALGNGVEAELRVMPDTSSEYRNILVPQLQAKSGDIDVFLTDVVWTAEFAAAGWMLDITDRFSDTMRKGFLDGPVSTTEFQNKYYGMPFYTDVGVFWYRKDMLDQLKVQPPETWDDLVKIGEATKEKYPNMSPFVFQAAQNEGLVCNALEYIWGNGGDVLDANGKVVLNSDKSVAALQTMADLIYKYKVSPQAVTSATTTENNQIFFAGQADMMRSWSFVWGVLSNNKTAAIKTDQLGISQVPHSPGGKSWGTAGGWNAAINPYSKNPDAAWTFVEWLTSVEGEKMNTMGRADPPTRAATYTDPEVIKAVPFIEMLAPVTKASKSRPVTPYYQDVSNALQRNFHAVLTQQASAADAIKKASDELNSILKSS